MKQILLAGLLGGVTLYVWGAVSWSLLPWHTATLREVPNTDVVMDVIQKNIYQPAHIFFLRSRLKMPTAG